MSLKPFLMYKFPLSCYFFPPSVIPCHLSLSPIYPLSIHQSVRPSIHPSILHGTYSVKKLTPFSCRSSHSQCEVIKSLLSFHMLLSPPLFPDFCKLVTESGGMLWWYFELLARQFHRRWSLIPSGGSHWWVVSFGMLVTTDNYLDKLFY